MGITWHDMVKLAQYRDGSWKISPYKLGLHKLPMPSSTKATLLEMMPKRWGSKGMKEQVNISSLWWLICVRDLSARCDRSIWYRNHDHIHQPLLNNYNSLHCHLLLFPAMVYGISCFNVRMIACHVGPLVASFSPRVGHLTMNYNLVNHVLCTIEISKCSHLHSGMSVCPSVMDWAQDEELIHQATSCNINSSLDSTCPLIFQSLIATLNSMKICEIEELELLLQIDQQHLRNSTYNICCTVPDFGLVCPYQFNKQIHRRWVRSNATWVNCCPRLHYTFMSSQCLDVGHNPSNINAWWTKSWNRWITS